VDTPTRAELIAANQPIEQIREYLGADSLGYLSLSGMLEAVGDAAGERFCTACYTGHYPTPLGRGVETSRERELVAAD
jgi:amidophosphoribosyltransferase